MKLHVHVHGIDFVVPCGEGGQTFKWLGLAVAQRYAQIAPHGRCRTREDVHLKQGFFLPGNMTKTQTGQVLVPTKKINEQCKDNDTITIELMQEIPVNEIGAPQFTPWAISAFCTTTQRGGGGGNDSLSGSAANTARAEPKFPDNHGSISSSSSCSKKTSIEEEMKEYSRSAMLQQMHAGLFHSELEIEAAFLHDWSKINVEEFEKEPKEKEKIQSILLDAFTSLNAAYLHYAVGASETSYGMSLVEFSHFIYEGGLFHFQKDIKIVEKIFTTALKQDRLVSMVSKELLSRVGFLHCIVRAVLIHTKMYGQDEDDDSSKNSLYFMIEQGIKQKIIPSIQKLTSGPFRDHTHQQKVIAIFQEARHKLLKLYARYADTTTGLLKVSALKSMFQEAGVFYTGEPEEQEEVFEKAIEQSFIGMKEIENPNHQVVVYAEFLEVVARVAIAMVKEDEGFSPREAIKIAVDALKSCPLKANRK